MLHLRGLPLLRRLGVDAGHVVCDLATRELPIDIGSGASFAEPGIDVSGPACYQFGIPRTWGQGVLKSSLLTLKSSDGNWFLVFCFFSQNYVNRR